MKLSVGLIARDSEATLRACLESLRDLPDELIIGLGGKSTDDTAAIAVAFTENVFEIEWHDDFAQARNEVMARVTGDYFMWLDADDVLQGVERIKGLIEANPDANCFMLPYEYERDEVGNVTCRLVRERIVRDPAAWHWEGAVHEVMMLDPDVPLTVVYDDDVRIIHQLDRPRDKGDRNLRLLRMELARTEPNPSPRTLLYLGRESASRGLFSEAVIFWNRYLSMAPTDNEAGQMAHQLANVHRSLGEYEKADVADLRSIRLAPDWPDGYLGMAQTAYNRREWPSVVEWTKAASTKTTPVTGLITNDLDYDYYPYYFLGLAYAQMGDVEMALENLKIAARVKPDSGLIETITSLVTEGDRQNVLTAFMALYQHLGRHDEWLKVRRLFELAPKLIETHPDVQEAWRKTSLSTAHVDDPQIMVDFYRGNPGWAPMSDETILSDAWRDHPRMKFARKALCGPPKWILDVGSSDGFISLPLAKDGYSVLGMDLDPRCTELAQKRANDWNVSAVYVNGSIDDLASDDKYDAALAFEIIEHLVDPGEFLDKLGEHANKVILTTPYLAWEGGRLKDWDKIEPKGHLRIFDLPDIEMLLTPRGRIVDLYREPWGTTGWIFASYYPGQRYKRKVTLLAPNTLEEWSPRKLAEQGLGGSETALIKLAEALASDHDTLCTTFGRIDHPGYYNGVRYRQAEAFIPEVSQDAYVAWRWPEAADLPIEGRMLLWMHDTDAGDRLTPVRAARFDKIVVLSEWHRDYMLKVYPFIPESKLVIIGNGVDASRFLDPEVVEREPLRVAYTSSPDRGLDVILEHIWPKVTEAVPDAELHVYYGWNNFDALKAAYPHLAAFQQKIAQLMLQNKNVIMHGRVTQEQIAVELRKASVWLYPTYFSETYCISAVEAQLAGAIPVTNDLAALAETVKAGEVIHGDVHDPKVAEHYVEAVIGLLRGVHVGLRSLVIREAPRFSWEDAASAWSDLLEVQQ